MFYLTVNGIMWTGLGISILILITMLLLSTRAREERSMPLIYDQTKIYKREAELPNEFYIIKFGQEVYYEIGDNHEICGVRTMTVDDVRIVTSPKGFEDWVVVEGTITINDKV